MKEKTSRNTAVVLLVLGALLVFGLWPLGSGKYRIRIDPEKAAYREAFLANPQVAADTVVPPNIIIILADDLGLADVSSYGGQAVRTRHIDAIGANGITFREAYVTSPICAPSRAGLLTGRYQQRFGFEINIHERYPKNRLEHFVYRNFLNTGDWKVARHQGLAVPRRKDVRRQGLPPSEFILPELLKLRGYCTAAIGKWHLGYNETATPNQRGFDYQYGFYEAFSLYAPEDDESIVNQRLSDFSDPFIWKKGRKGNCAIRKNGEVVEENTYLTTKLAEEAKNWISAHRKGPFFLYLPFSAPHTPFQATRDYYDRYAHIDSPEKRIYYAMIHALDDAVGEVMGHLKALGLEERTLVFFLSDNGGAEYTLAADNDPLRGGKFTNFEGGLRVPFMMQWPGHLPAGMIFEQPVSTLDIFATCVELAGVTLPDDRSFDGVDLLPFLLEPDRAGRSPHEALYWRSEYHKAIRRGDWKLIRDELADRTVLYQLSTDLSERQDRSADFPEVVSELQRELQTWEQELVAPAWPRVMDYEIHDGAEVFYFPL